MDESMVGKGVVFVDQLSREHQALVTADWGVGSGTPADRRTINVVFVSHEDEKKDQYGRQIVRETSVPAQAVTTAPGFYWKSAV